IYEVDFSRMPPIAAAPMTKVPSVRTVPAFSPSSTWNPLDASWRVSRFAGGSARSEPSHAQMRAHHLVRQFANRPGSDSPALVEDTELACYSACERQLLLDQQHGQPFFLIQLQDDVPD